MINYIFEEQFHYLITTQTEINQLITYTMNKTEIFTFAALMVFVGIRLYMKYVKKDKPGNDKQHSSGNQYSAPSKEEDYEPYSKK
jgi:hypothetical protein